MKTKLSATATNFALLLTLPLVGAACSSAPKKPAHPEASPRSELPEWATPYYLHELPFAIDAAEPPPPALGSEGEKKDIAELLRWQKVRTKAQCDAARAQSIPTMDNVFGKSASQKGAPDFEKLDAGTYVQLKNFFDRFQRDVIFVSLNAKDHWKRKRPYVENPEIKPCIRLETSYAYPSGHGSFVAAGAIVLSEIFPKNAAALNRASKQGGLNRIIGGVHHPSDVSEGYVLGQKVVDALKKEAKFIADLEQIKQAIADSKPSKAKTAAAR